jgi:hypothetical protein
MNQRGKHLFIGERVSKISVRRCEKSMEHFLTMRGFSCIPINWCGQGARLIPHDERHAFRYEVRDQRGTIIGFINTDRARQHPDVKWERSLLHDGDGDIEELVGKYATVREALEAF